MSSSLTTMIPEGRAKAFAPIALPFLMRSRKSYPAPTSRFTMAKSRSTLRASSGESPEGPKNLLSMILSPSRLTCSIEATGMEEATCFAIKGIP